ncbi:metallophosphoesterase [Candidatus Dependentiae bacterium]|nr:metallophosphoesterase [Candidatus Dependentiae bacterium]MBU4387512.1 metallophosphoesterase [Candidatus Dependentiae bacterium]MCG2756793.1 metallophosphoesterase [Candidatus Dependentiae bacterium]
MNKRFLLFFILLEQMIALYGMERTPSIPISKVKKEWSKDDFISKYGEKTWDAYLRSKKYLRSDVPEVKIEQEPAVNIKQEPILSIDIPKSKTLEELSGVKDYIELKKIFSAPKEVLEKLTKKVLDLSINNEISLLNTKEYWFDSAQDINLNTESLDKQELYYIKKSDVKNGERYIVIGVIGDLHGNFEAFDQIIMDLIENRKILSSDLKITNDYKFIGLGDFVDRGKKSLNIVLIFMILRLINGEGVIFLKGNHEDSALTSDVYDFSEELMDKLDWDTKSFYNFFKLLPVAYFAKDEKDKFSMFSHGGWTRTILKQADFFKSDKIFLKINSQMAHFLLWNDIDFISESSYGIRPSNRGDGVYEMPYKSCLSDMRLLGIYRKYNGHMHLVPKGNPQSDEYDNLRYYHSPGFTYKHSLLDEDTQIYTIISSSIIYDEFGIENISYYPSYLELCFYSLGCDVHGYIKKENNNFFTRTAVKKYHETWEYLYF